MRKILLALIMISLFVPMRSTAAIYAQDDPCAADRMPQLSQETAEALKGKLSGKLAFVSHSTFTLYTMDMATFEIRCVTLTDLLGAANPSWSPDGKQLVVEVGGGTRASDYLAWSLFIVDPSSGKSRRLDNTFNSNMPDWSPDGKQIAFTSTALNDVGLKVVNADGSSAKLVLSTPDSAIFNPVWAADSTQIAFSGTVAAGKSGIFVINADGSKLRQLTSFGNDYVTDWSGENDQILFSGYRTKRWQIYVMRSDGTQAHQLITDQADDWMATWSPDAKYIAFISITKDGAELNIADADGSHVVKLLDLDIDLIAISYFGLDWVK
jgi:TolB protein